MKHVSAAEANRNFAKLMREAERGETVVVTSHGEPRVTIAAYQRLEADASEVRRREEAWRALWERVASQPETTIRWRFSRDELYDESEP